MTVLDNIRPRVDHLTEERSRELLQSVLAAPVRRPRRHWSRISAVALSGLMIAGGAAYATGLVPEIVTDRFQQMGEGDLGWPEPIVGERQVVDVELSNGEHARVWHADTTDGLCVIRDMSGATRPEDLSVTCALWGYGAEKADPRRGVHWQTSVGGPAVVYADFDGVTDKVSRVEVSGPGWTRSFDVRDEAAAGEVPAGREGDRVRLSYLDARGELIAREVVMVGIESE